MVNPELTFPMAVEDYRKQGYSDKWIENRLKSIRTRNELINGSNDWSQANLNENDMWRKWRNCGNFRHKRHFRHLRNYEWSIDFQGERMLEAISADFLRWAEKVSAGSP